MFKQPFRRESPITGRCHPLSMAGFTGELSAGKRLTMKPLVDPPRGDPTNSGALGNAAHLIDRVAQCAHEDESPVSVLSVHHRRELKVHSSRFIVEPMVHANESRAEFSARLREALEHAGKSGRGEGAWLKKITDVTPKAASKWLNGESRPGHDKAIALAAALGVREDWLLYGRGEMKQHQTQDSRAAYQVESNVSPGPAVAGQAPELNWVQAGSWTEICQADPDPEANAWHPRIAGGEKTFVLRVAGESMLPDYPPGRLIFVDPERTPRNGDDVIAVLTENDQATFKRYLEEPGSGRMLKALNPDWRDPYIPINGNCEIIGVVVADMRVR